ncbi:MAG: Sir2 family NAD-dependent protein deacetylase, partial [Bacteroidota bacterium]
DDVGAELSALFVWFGEDVPEIINAAGVVAEADLVLIVGTSMQVYPAAGLVGYAPDHAPVIYIDPNPTISYELQRRKDIHTIEMGGSEGMEVARELIGKLLG